MTDSPSTDVPGILGRRCWTLVGDLGTVDVEVTAAHHHRIAEILPVVAGVVGGPVDGLWTGSTHLSDDTPLTAPVLDHGAILGIGRPVRHQHADSAPSALEVRVVGGPDAGRSFALGQGSHLVGRSGDVHVRLDDPDVSRRHASVHVGGGIVTVTDLGSSNGSRLDGADLELEPRIWPTGAVLRLGGSALVLAGPEAPAASLVAGPDGRRRVRPLPRMSAPVPEVEVRFPRPPAEAPRRRLAWVAVALPAVGGVTMAWLLDAPTFLFFALLSPVVALGTWLSERWSGRRSGRQEAAAHALEVEASQARLAEAVRADVRAAEAAHPDLATLAAAARRRTPLLWSRTRDDADALGVRIGTGPGATRVVRIDGDGTRTREPAPHLPVVVDLRSTGGMAVVGPRGRTTGALSTVLAQLCALHAPGELDLLLLVTADRLSDWAWSRWLPHLDADGVQILAAEPVHDRSGPDGGLHARLVALTAGRQAMTAGTVEHRHGWLVVVIDGDLDPRSSAVLRAARSTGVVVLATADGQDGAAVDVDAVLRLSGETGDIGVLSRQGLPDRGEVAVDRLPSTLAARLARELAALAPVTTESALPRRVRLLDEVAAGRRPGGADGVPVSWTRARDRLVAPLGRTAHGPLEVDLCRLGPHALIAGTTGSGKSELLQTLVAGLALNHPPDRCSFLLVDYKGGAAFAEASSLPHTVGMVTDLDGQTTARALRSLAAELTRRERALAAHGAADIAALPESADLARLVIVVDEFAGLSEELPEFVPGLVAIAQRGRSLGVHLVLATQRPSGVISPEIRANCNLRICLRTTDEAESRDVLGTPQAAHLPLDAPGRAWLRAGSGTPTALQVARVAGHAPVAAGTTPTARPWTWPFPEPPREDPRAGSGDSDLARICRVLDEHCRATGAPRPHRPWRPPLPDSLLPGTLEDRTPPSDVRRTVLALGLVDRPDLQSRETLRLDLADGGTWLAVGGPRSGRTTLLRTVLAEAVDQLGPDELQVHVLEAGAGMLGADAAALPHSGTIVSGEDVLRIVRLVDRLAQEVAGRRAGSHAGSARILLLVDGVETISTVLDEFDPGRGSANLLRLMRDGAAVGLTCVATTDRAVPGGRLAAVARQRLVLPLPDRADYAVAGIAARDVPARRTPGRALVGEEARECQLVLPRPVSARAATSDRRSEALRIVELPADPWLPAPALDSSSAAPALHGGLLLSVGPGGDEGQPLTVDLLRTGGLLVTGPSGSGRSSALTAFAQDAASRGAAVLILGRPPSPADGAPRLVPGAVTLHAADEQGTAEWLDGLDGRPGVVVADDIGAPHDVPALSRVTGDLRRGVVLIAAADAGQLSAHYQGPVAALRRSRTGLLLCPGAGDADLLGVRLPRTPLPQRPGSGWLVTAVGMQRVQVARRRHPMSGQAPESGPWVGQSSSSAEPISCRAYQASS